MNIFNIKSILKSIYSIKGESKITRLKYRKLDL